MAGSGRGSRRGSLRSNVAAGVVAGVAGTLAMDAYWKAYYQLRPRSGSSGEEPATVKVARRGLRLAGVRSPSRRTRALGGKIVHWSYGALWGAAVGLSHWAGVPLDRGGGQLLGVGLWAFGDEWMLYRLGVTKNPRTYPVATHLSSLGAHLVYGLGAWAAGAATRRTMERLPAPQTRLRRAA